MALTELQKMAIEHCVNQLKKVDTQKVFSWVWSNGLISGSDEEKRAFFNSFSAMLGEHINAHVSDVTEWLNTLQK